MARDGSGTYYVDGGSRDTLSYTQDAATNPDRSFLIGARNNASSASVHMEGKIDEVSIFDRALTPAEVAVGLYAGAILRTLTS